MKSDFSSELRRKDSRFGWIRDGRRFGPDSEFDVDLAQFDDAAVIPTRGAMIPEWLMLVPRRRCLAIAELKSTERLPLLDHAREIAGLISSRSGSAVLFEHGAAAWGTAHACGVEQGHLHVVGLPGSFASWVITDSANLNWQSVPVCDPWKGISPNRDYLLLWVGKCGWVAYVAQPVSQFFRRKIAEFLSRPEEWDYRRYPHVSNARRTAELFSIG